MLIVSKLSLNVSKHQGVCFCLLFCINHPMLPCFITSDESWTVMFCCLIINERNTFVTFKHASCHYQNVFENNCKMACLLLFYSFANQMVSMIVTYFFLKGDRI